MADLIRLPEWENEGVEPSANLKENGFVAGYKPPAAVFNWLFNKLIKRANENTERGFDFYREISGPNFDNLTEEGIYKCTGAKNAIVIVNRRSTTLYQMVLYEMRVYVRFGKTDGTWGEPIYYVTEDDVDERTIVGTYTGLGDWTQNIHFANLGYKPKKIEIVPAKAGNFSAAVLIQDCPYSAVMRSTNESYGIALDWTDNGVLMTPYKSGSTNIDYPTILCDEKDVVYHYIIYK